MVDHIEIMIAAVIIAAVVMVFSATPLGNFVERHPTVKMLALSFLLLIGFTLIVEGLHQHIPKGYIYFAMGFAVLVEMLNLRVRGSQPVTLHEPYREAVAGGVAAAVANVPVKTPQSQKKKTAKKRR
jgi:predicted tellurium resistance membrane protein TerC